MPSFAKTCCGMGRAAYSEESIDDLTRKSRLREFIAGIPEFCAFVAMVEESRPVVVGIYNPGPTRLSWGQLLRLASTTAPFSDFRWLAFTGFPLYVARIRRR